MKPTLPARSVISGLAGLLAWVAIAQAAPAPMPRVAAPGATNQLVIICDGGAVATLTNAIWRKNVRAADSQFYLECQELTAVIRGRPAPGTAGRPAGAAARGGGADTNRARIEAIIADTDVMVVTPELQVLGDRAMYTASNDVLRVSGLLVIVADAHGSTICTNFTFDRAANVITVDGPQATVLREGAFARTNAPGRVPGPPARRQP